MGREPKSKFEDLDKDYMTSIESATDDEIRAKIAQVALNNAALQEAKGEDQQLAELKEQVKEAGAIYREGAKANKLRIEYARYMLDSRGKDSGESGVE